MSKRTYQRRFREAVARAGFPGRITSHTLRHSFARHAIANRVPPSVLQHALGHAHLSTTLIYMELVPDPDGSIARLP